MLIAKVRHLEARVGGGSGLEERVSVGRLGALKEEIAMEDVQPHITVITSDFQNSASIRKYGKVPSFASELKCLMLLSLNIDIIIRILDRNWEVIWILHNRLLPLTESAVTSLSG